MTTAVANSILITKSTTDISTLALNKKTAVKFPASIPGYIGKGTVYKRETFQDKN